MASTDLFISSPIPNVELFEYPIDSGSYDAEYENRLPLGKQIEDQLEMALAKDERYSVIAKGVQIQPEGITLGELDFIIKDHEEGAVFHLELVYKYYIYDPIIGGNEIERWIGPNKRDRLVYKLDKLSSGQFPLLYHSATRPYLEALGLDPESVTQKLCFKAELYRPYHSDLNLRGQLNPNAIQGHYLYIDQLAEKMTSDKEYHVCTYQEWIQDESSCEFWIDAGSCQDQLQQKADDGRAIMVWTKQNNSFERFFVLFKP